MSLNGQTVAVHLVVYTHFYGYIPGKKQIDHLCNNRLCCNPAHLEMVSHLLNQKRRAACAKDKPAPQASSEPDGHGRQIAAHSVADPNSLNHLTQLSITPINKQKVLK